MMKAFDILIVYRVMLKHRMNNWKGSNSVINPSQVLFSTGCYKLTEKDIELITQARKPPIR